MDAGVSYEDRVARRKEEIESLQEALRILNGAREPLVVQAPPLQTSTPNCSTSFVCLSPAAGVLPRVLPLVSAPLLLSQRLLSPSVLYYTAGERTTLRAQRGRLQVQRAPLPRWRLREKCPRAARASHPVGGASLGAL